MWSPVNTDHVPDIFSSEYMEIAQIDVNNLQQLAFLYGEDEQLCKLLVQNGHEKNKMTYDYYTATSLIDTVEQIVARIKPPGETTSFQHHEDTRYLL